MSTITCAETFHFPIVSDGVALPQLTDTISKAYEALGHSIVFESMPAKRALLEAEHNEKYDGELARVVEAESLFSHLIRVPVPVFEANLTAVTHDSEFQVKSIEALGNYHLGAIRGIVFTDRAFKNMPAVELLNELEQGIRMLELGRIDVLVVPKMMAKKFIGGYASKPTLYFHSLPIPAHKLHHFVHTKHAAMIPELTKAISRITGFPIETSSNFGKPKER